MLFPGKLPRAFLTALRKVRKEKGGEGRGGEEGVVEERNKNVHIAVKTHTHSTHILKCMLLLH